jgi:hypothetical protein
MPQGKNNTGTHTLLLSSTVVSTSLLSAKRIYMGDLPRCGTRWQQAWPAQWGPLVTIIRSNSAPEKFVVVKEEE